jgi:putative hydrolase
VSNVPFGFGPPSGDDPERSGENRPDRPGGGDPFSAMLGGGAMDPAAIGAAFQRLGQLMSWQGGPVNWDLARDVARQATAAGSDRSVGAAESAAVADAVRVAEIWLDGATALPAGTTGAVAWSRAEWVEGTLAAWQRLVDPVAGKVVDAMGAAMTQNVPEEMRVQVQAMAGPMQQMMRAMGGAMFGAQVGQALGSLAEEVLGLMDVGLPLGPVGRAVLLPANVAAFGTGLGVPEEEVRLYLALREAAHHRLYAHVPWLGARVLDTVADYARGITIDTSRIESQLSGIDPTNPQALQDALSGGMFEPQTTPAQQQALRRLEGLLALIEGWVDEIVDAAAAPHLPSASALRETVRRRRATGGPAEATFAALVGLELRPRRLREAADLWRGLAAARGTDGRDAVWGHPDLLPTPDDLDDPQAFAAGGSPDLDLSGLADLSPGPRPAEDAEGGEGGEDRPGGDRLGEERPGEDPQRPG